MAEEIKRRLPRKESLDFLLSLLGCFRLSGYEEKIGVMGYDCKVKALGLLETRHLFLLVKAEKAEEEAEEEARPLKFLGKDGLTYSLFEARYAAGAIEVLTAVGNGEEIAWRPVAELFSRLPWWFKIKAIFTPY